MKDQIVAYRVVGEGWYIEVYRNGELIVKEGPRKTKPPMPKIRRLQWKHELGAAEYHEVL